MSNVGAGVIARGKIKVDAQKALHKLRDHMLVDHHLWACEVARVAVALGASLLEIDYDADDVVLSFCPKRLPAIEVIGRARDHVLTPPPEGDDEGDAMRLLGIGVSAALALDPSFVDVYRAGEGQEFCERVRFESHHLEADDVDVEDTPKPERVARPADMKSARAMRVHMRRRLGFDLLGRALKRDVPREIMLLIDAARDAPLEVLVRSDASLKRSPPPPAVLRVDLDDPAVTRGALEILKQKAHVRPDCCVTFLERGIRLVRYSLNVGLFQPLEEGALPARVVIDAPRLPTNASRSELRMDTDLMKRLLARIEPAFITALDTLEAAGLRGEHISTADIGHAPELLTNDRAELMEALGYIVAEVARTTRQRPSLAESDRAKALLELPLLMDAMGQPMSFVDLKGGPAAPLHVYHGRVPVPRELAPWLKGVVWRRGFAAEQGLADRTLAPADDLVARAFEAHGRRDRALQHPPSSPTLAASPAHLLRERFEVKQGPFAGLNGEVAILKGGSEFRRSSTVRLFVDDRLLETTQLPGVGLNVEIALGWPGQIVATFDYHAVERTEALSKAILYALRLASTVAGERLSGPAPDPELARLAVAAWCAATSTLRDAEMTASSLGRLASLRAWSTTDGRHVSILEIEDYVKRTKALCVAAPTSQRVSAPDGRPVILDDQVEALRPLLLGTSIVRYDAALAQPPDASAKKLAEEASGLTAVPIHQGNIDGFLSVCRGDARRRTYHAGFLLRDEPYHPRGGPVTLVIDDRAAVPTATFDGLLWSSILVGLAREEDALTELVIERCEQGEIDFGLVKSWVEDAEERLRKRSPALAARLAELPKKVEAAQRLARRAAVLAKPKADLESIFRTPAIVGLSKAPTHGRIESPVGRVIVALAKEHLRAEIFFGGHPVGTTILSSLPIIAVIDLQREDYIGADWCSLDKEKGERWARSAIVEASLLLLSELVKDEAFVRTSLALDLWLGLHESSPQRVSRMLASVAWPTVQGGKMWLPEKPGQVLYGTVAYSPFLTHRANMNEEVSPFDAPTILLRRDWLTDLWMRVLAAAGHELIDVTDPIARLQQRRARGLPTAPPRLGGDPPKHGFLRASLTSLGQTIVEGEIELIEGEHSEVARVSEDGTTYEWPPMATGYVPARIVFRPDPSASDDAIQGALVQSIGRLLGRLVGHIEEAPFLKQRLRFMLCEGLKRGERPADLEPLEIFPTIRGHHLSLTDILARREIHVTYDPPWHALGIERTAPILYLSHDEALALNKVVTVLDVTEGLRTERQGVERREARPLESIALPDEVRARCLATFAIADAGITGEIGILLPSHANERRVDLFTTMRPLCRILDPDGWPLVAVINDDEIVANVGFDGIADDSKGKSVARVHLALKIAVGRQMPTILDAPRNTAGVIRLPTPYLIAKATMGGQRPVSAIGVFWLTRQWPEIPELRVETIGGVDPFRSPAIRDFSVGELGERAHHGLLPIAGRVYLSAPAGSWAAETALDDVLRWVRTRLAAIVRSWHRSSDAEHLDEIRAYEWDLALLGVSPPVEDRDPLAELALDRPDDVLVKVAARRTPHLMTVARPESIDVPERRENQAQTPVAPDETDVGRMTPVPPPAPSPDRPSFLGGLVRRVVRLFGGEGGIATTDSPLARALGSALVAMKLTGEPVTSVVESTNGRPVRYDKANKRIVINTSHASIRKLMPKKSCVLVLLASAVSEVNRELEPVTDAEELAILLDLLRANESR